MGSKKENKRKPGVQTTVSPAVHFSLSLPCLRVRERESEKKHTYIHRLLSFFPIINVGSVATGTLGGRCHWTTAKGDVTSFFLTTGNGCRLDSPTCACGVTITISVILDPPPSLVVIRHRAESRIRD